MAYMELGLEREKMSGDLQLKAQDMAQKREMQRVEQARAAAQAAQKPQPQGAPR